MPGSAYFKISTNPSLEQNFFVSKDDTGSLKIGGVGSTVGGIESVYVWNKDKIVGNHYNALYTTLL